MSILQTPDGGAAMAAAVAADCGLRKEARRLLRDDLTCRDYLAVLTERGLHADAIAFLARALPKRRAVWWGCLCAWHMVRPEPSPVEEEGLEAAVRWALDPSEENRRAAEMPGPQEELDTPAACLARAAFWSGGSLAPAGLPEVPPPAGLTGRLVAGAILLAGVRRDFRHYRDHYRQFLALGLEVARGENLWPAPEAGEVPASDKADDRTNGCPGGQVATDSPAPEETLVTVG
jgi:hypothetical protein